MSLLNVQDLVDYMSNIVLSAGQRDAAREVLDGVQGEVEQFLNRRLEPVTVTETVQIDEDGYAQLSQSPIISITGVTLGDAAPLAVPPQPATIVPWSLNVRGLYVTYGLLAVGANAYLDPNYANGTAVVTYVAGIDGVNGPNAALLRLTILRVAAREMTNRHDDVLGVAEVTTTRPPPVQLIGLTDDDRKRIERMRRRVVA